MQKHANKCRQKQELIGAENFGFKSHNVDIVDIHAHVTFSIFRNALNLFEKTRKCGSQPLDLERLQWQCRCYTQSMLTGRETYDMLRTEAPCLPIDLFLRRYFQAC